MESEVKNAQTKSVFETLNAINVNGHTEKKNGLTYLSWAWAWAEVKKLYPDTFYKVYEDARGLNYFCDGHTCYVKTGVTIEGLEMIEYLPVMDFKNKSITCDMVTSFDVNKAIQRCLTKAIARHGLGLYIYAGEDLPEEEQVNLTEPQLANPKCVQTNPKFISTNQAKMIAEAFAASRELEYASPAFATAFKEFLAGFGFEKSSKITENMLHDVYEAAKTKP